jgi:hypothetical protein
MQAAMSEMSTVEGHQRAPEARYAYYRRCQVFRRNGVQCKAPAEKGAHICHAHAGQLAMAVRRERERRAVLAEAVAEMRRRGRPECEMADLFTDFKGIQVTTAVMARAVISGRIDCKTAGQMVVQLQTFSKLLRQIHRKGHKGRKDLPLIGTDNTDLKKLPKAEALTTKDTRSIPLSQAQGHSGQATEHEGLPRICADARRLKTKNLPLINTDNTDLKKLPRPGTLPQNNADGADRKKSHVGKKFDVTFSKHRPALAPLDGGSRILPFEVAAFGDGCRAHGPPESKAA